MKNQNLISLSFDSMSSITGGQQQDNSPDGNHTTKCLLMIFGSGIGGYLTGMNLGGIYQVLSTFSGMALGAASGCF